MVHLQPLPLLPRSCGHCISGQQGFWPQVAITCTQEVASSRGELAWPPRVVQCLHLLELGKLSFHQLSQELGSAAQLLCVHNEEKCPKRHPGFRKVLF